jgi:hypothetical protein
MIIMFCFRIGLCGFDNPMRDQKTEEFKRHIGHVSILVVGSCDGSLSVVGVALTVMFCRV